MANLVAGDIALHRSIWENDYLNRNPKPFSKREAFVWLISRANHKPNDVLLGDTLYKVERGEFVTSQKKLEKAFNWGNTAVRTYLKQLQKLGMISFKTTTQATQITISKYCTYQDSQQTTKLKPTDDQQATNTRPTTNNNDKNDKNVKNKINTISDLQLIVMVEPYINKYGRAMLEEFINHWGETPLNGGKMLCLKQKGFAIPNRLAMWARNDWSGFFNLHKQQVHQAKLDAERKNASSDEGVDVMGFGQFREETFGNVFKKVNKE